MELNITNFFYNSEPVYYQDSVANSGLENIGHVTWQNALRDSDDHTFATEQNQKALKGWLAEFGAWSPEEMDTWDLKDLNALMIQFVAGWVEEKNRFTWEEYEKESCAGQVSGCLYEDTEGNVYASIDCSRWE